jgi:hypothetical protein
MAGRYCNMTSVWRPGGVLETRPGIRLFAKLLCVAAVLVISIIGAAAALAQTPPGTTIENTAVGRYSVGGITNLSVSSNRVQTVTVELRTPATIEFL